MIVSIVGAGPVGLLAAIYASKSPQVSEIHIFERRSRQEVENSSAGGRSINLALSERGLRALREADLELEGEILRGAVPMRGRLIHDLNAESFNETRLSYGKQAVMRHFIDTR